jgi:L-ascorbate metabolism protein UlaG (beta-lactamase superfamily)
LIPGDSTEQVGITAEIVAVPIFGPDISYHDAFEMAEAYEAKTVIPVHFDVARMDPTTFEFFTNHVGARGGNYKVAIIPNGETRSFELKHA